MKNRASIWLYIMVLLGYIYGIVAICSLIFIPLGIYSISGAIYYSQCAKLTDSELYTQKQRLNNWSIFFSIFLFPIGLISLIIAYIAGDNKISVSETEQEKPHATVLESDDQKTEQPKQTSSAEQKIISEQDMQKFEELKKYREQGLITNEEFERAKHEIFD